MKKFNVLFLLVAGLLIGTQSFGQFVPDKGTKLLNLGIGLGNYGGIGFGGGGLAFGGSIEVGVIPNLTVGAVGSFRSYSNIGSYYSIGARGSYHFNQLLSLSDEKFDLYAGAGLVYSGFSYKDGFLSSAYSYGGVGLGLHIGGRYFFSDNVGAFLETGVGFAPLQLGVTFKF